MESESPCTSAARGAGSCGSAWTWSVGRGAASVLGLRVQNFCRLRCLMNFLALILPLVGLGLYLVCEERKAER